MTGSSPSTSLAPPTPPVRTVTRPLIETDPRPETGRALMLATMYQGEDSHAPTRREYFRSEEHTSELQSLMRISYAVFCLKKKTITTQIIIHKANQIKTNRQPHTQSRD